MLVALDRRLLAVLHRRWPALRVPVAAFSRLGDHGAVWLAMGVAGRHHDGDPRWTRGMRLTLGAYVVNQLVKFTVRRPRPAVDHFTSTDTNLSFPSAHATNSFAAARAYRGLLPGWLRYGLAGALALSRPYLGVHYPSDVLAGAILGTVVGSWR